MGAFARAAPSDVTGIAGRRLLTKPEEAVVKSNWETAHKLGLTEHTISNYLFKIYEKLGISSRVELVLYSLKDHR